MAITPDTKDWTWVVEQRCPECGFDARLIARADVPSLIRANAARWGPALAAETARERPRPDVWSAVEYACHVRDVHRLYGERLAMMLTLDNPEYPNWDQDETAVQSRYHEQEPTVVDTELREEAERIARSFEAISADQWERTGRRSDGALFTIDTFARYYLHDITHHVFDVSGSR